MFPKRTRLKTFDYLGAHRYFLTFCTADRHHVFEDAGFVELVLMQFLRAAASLGFSIVAYCFMPDHVHLLVEGLSPDSDLRRFAKDAKQYSGFEYKQKKAKALWQPSYYENVLREDDDAWSVARYIIENPLRARLVERVDEYPFLGSAVVEKAELLTFVHSAAPWEEA